MIYISEALNNLFYNNTNIKIDSGCYIEYNMNDMIDATSVTSNIADSVYTSQIVNPVTNLPVWPANRANPYKKLFPVDSIVKPFRPSSSGIKYFILANGEQQVFSPYRTVQYPSSQPRVYYPGVDTFYKYWVTPKNTGVDIKVDYAPTGTKYALINRIVIKFEKNHTLPSSYTVKIKKSDNTEDTIADAFTTPSNGIIILDYNGTSWSTNGIVEPASYGSPISIKSISLTTPSGGTGNIIGVIEVAGKWIKDISTDVVNFDISKEASSSSENLLPVGQITANSLSINLNKYNESLLQYREYNRTETLNSSINYMVKNAKLYPYFKIYHSGGQITEGSTVYDKIYQGHFHIDSWSIDDYGQTSVTALDSGKYLMETIAPDIICEYYPVTSIIRRLLDSVGFVDYAFNLTSDSDSSIPIINYFWTDGSKTIWDHLQELCRDIQMNAIMDENNILQFYSRNYMYGNRSQNWNFYYDQEGSKLPNIIDFSKKEIASANEVKVIWSTPISSSYLGASGPLWQSPTTFLVAGGLKEKLTETSNKIILDLQAPDAYTKFQSGFNFSGYFLVDSEVIEFDAIGYQYMPKYTTPSTIYDVLKETNVTNNGATFINIWIENSNDVNKYRNFSKLGSTTSIDNIYFKPNGAYRIKTRGALGTKAAAHNDSGSPTSQIAWTGMLVTQNA